MIMYVTRPAHVVSDVDEQLVAQLHRLGVRHLVRLSELPPEGHLFPSELIAALAGHPQARFRAALIVLFLRRPEFWEDVKPVADRLEATAALTLKLYYQAAVYLQRELEAELKPLLKNWRRLPDLFSQEYGLPPADAIRSGPRSSDFALAALGEAHRRLSGWDYNWAGSYRHDVPRMLKPLRSEEPVE